MGRPKIEVQPEPFDKILDVLGFITLGFLIILPMYYFDQLPDEIPKHYGANGEPDGYGSKNVLWTLPVLGVIMFLGLYWMNKYPHTFNFPQKVTEKNAEFLYKNVTRMIRLLNVIMTGTFTYITHVTIQNSLGNEMGLGNWFTIIFLGLIFGIIGYYLYQTSKKQATS